MKIKDEDLERIKRKVRRDEHRLLGATISDKVFKDKSKYTRKQKHKSNE